MCIDAAVADRLRGQMDSALTGVLKLWLLATKQVPWSYGSRQDNIDLVVAFLEAINDEIPKKVFDGPASTPEVRHAGVQPVPVRSAADGDDVRSSVSELESDMHAEDGRGRSRPQHPTRHFVRRS